MATAEKILVVDDNVETVKMIELVLDRAGYQAIAAHNGNEALDIAQRELPDLILMDIMMPGMDGYEVTQKLRNTTATADIPIIIFTAKSSLDDQLMGFKSGADDYLDKTSSPAELVARVRAVLSRTAKMQQRGKLVGVVAAKGGLGVTTLTINVGMAIHQKTQQDVIVADFRPGQGSLALTLGFSRPDNLNNLLHLKGADIDAKKVERELVRHKTGLRLLLSSYQPRDTILSHATSAFRAIAISLTQLANYTLIDLGPGLPPSNSEVLKSCDEILVVIEPSPPTLMQTKALLEDLRAQNVNVNAVRYVLFNRGGSSLQLSRDQVEEQLEDSIEMLITPAAEMAYQAALSKMPLIMVQPGSIVAEQFNNLAEAIIQRLG